MRFITAASLAALCGSVAAHPANGAAPAPTPAPRVQRRDDGSFVWITVDKFTSAKTITPTATVKDGTTIWDNEPPYSLTGSVYTTKNWDSMYTNTQAPPNPRPDNQGDPAGYMLKCTMTGDMEKNHNPICRPALNATLSSDLHYFVTWDPAFYNNSISKRDDKNITSSNRPIVVGLKAEYWNDKNSSIAAKWDTAWQSDMTYNASSGFAVFLASDLKTNNNGTNIKLSLIPSYANNRDQLSDFAMTPLQINVEVPLGRPANKSNSSLPKGAALYIGIPVAFGAVILLVCGGCWWNRKTRRIDLGNIMKRSRRGYSGRKERRRMFDATRPEDGGIQLRDNENDFDAHDHGFSAPVYRDAPDHSSAKDGSFQQQDTTGGRNAFRDEVARQNEERRQDY